MMRRYVTGRATFAPLWGLRQISSMRLSQSNSTYNLDFSTTPSAIQEVQSASYLGRLQRYVLPRGYPATVAVGFEKYYVWAVVSICANAFSTTISTQALLRGFFLESTALTWMLKDIFPAFFSSFLIGFIATFDTRSRYWFMVSGALFQICVFAEFTIAYAASPQYLLYGGIVVGLGKMFAFLISGITRASFHQHFATNQNLGDVTKCFNTVALVAYTMSSALGLLFVACVSAPALQFAAIACSSVVSLVCAKQAVQCIHSRILTRLSMSVIASMYAKSSYTQIPTPNDVADILGIRSEAPPGSLSFLLNPPLGKLELEPTFSSTFTLFTETLRRSICVFVARDGGLVMIVEKNSSMRDVVFGVVLCESLLLSAPSNMAKEIEALAAHEEVWDKRVDALFKLLEERGWDSTSHCIDHASMRYYREKYV